jgi:hypothetical protein
MHSLHAVDARALSPFGPSPPLCDAAVIMHTASLHVYVHSLPFSPSERKKKRARANESQTHPALTVT